MAGRRGDAPAGRLYAGCGSRRYNPDTMPEAPVTATLLISCRDQKGLVASVSDFLYRNNGNIIHADQHTDLEEAIFLQRVELLARAATIDEILTVQDRLNTVRLEIEQVTGRLNVLNNLTDFATITVRLSLPPAIAQGGDNQNWAEEAWQASFDVSKGALVALGTVAIVGGVFLAWMAVPALALLVLWRILGRRITEFARKLNQA